MFAIVEDEECAEHLSKMVMQRFHFADEDILITEAANQGAVFESAD